MRPITLYKGLKQWTPWDAGGKLENPVNLQDPPVAMKDGPVKPVRVSAIPGKGGAGINSTCFLDIYYLQETTWKVSQILTAAPPNTLMNRTEIWKSDPAFTCW